MLLVIFLGTTLVASQDDVLMKESKPLHEMPIEDRFKVYEKVAQQAEFRQGDEQICCYPCGMPYGTAQEKFNYHNFAKGYRGRHADDMYLAIWQQLAQEGFSPEEKFEFIDDPFIRAAMSSDLKQLSATFAGKSPEELNVLFQCAKRGIPDFRLLDLTLAYGRDIASVYLIARGAIKSELPGGRHPFNHGGVEKTHPAVPLFMEFCANQAAFLVKYADRPDILSVTLDTCNRAGLFLRVAGATDGDGR
jgi:hypothetical protein